MKVAWIALSGEAAGGYGKVGAYLLGALKDAGAEVCQFRALDWDVRVGVGGPRSWVFQRGQQHAADLVWHTMFEAWPLPPDWAPVLNRCAAVWVPAAWNVALFRASGVTVPLYVSGYGVNPDEFSPALFQRADGPSNLYTFAWAGTSLGDGAAMGDRKGGDLVLAAFRKLNLPQSRLILKATSRSAIQHIRGDDRIHLFTESLDVTHYAALLAHADCFVYPSHGEGFGLQPLEAMALGKPVIAPTYSGLADFIHEGVALPLPVAGEEPAWQFRQIYDHECVWARLALDDICDRMHWCYTHRAEAAAIGLAAAEYVAREWTWQQAGVRALGVLQTITGVA